MSELNADGLSIVMVDDDEEDIYSMRRGFSACDPSPQFSSVSSGVDFFKLLEQSVAKDSQVVAPDLVLLDLNLPNMPGIEILERLRKGSIRNLVPVIVMSTSRSIADAERSYRSGANAFFTKPATFLDTKLVAAAIVAFWQTPGIKISI